MAKKDKDEFMLGYNALSKSIRRGDVDVSLSALKFLYENGYSDMINHCLSWIYFKYVSIANPDFLLWFSDFVNKKSSDYQSYSNFVSMLANGNKTYASLSLWSTANKYYYPLKESYAKACDNYRVNQLVMPYYVFATRFGILKRNDFLNYIKSYVKKVYYDALVILSQYTKDGYDIPVFVLFSKMPVLKKIVKVDKKRPVTFINGFPDYAITLDNKYGKAVSDFLSEKFSSDENLLTKYNEFIEGYLSPCAYYNIPIELVGVEVTPEELASYASLYNEMVKIRRYVMQNYYKGAKMSNINGG